MKDRSLFVQKLEIVLITYNRADFLEHTINAFRESLFSNCKLTIFDNCSTDRTREIYDKYYSDFESLHFIRNPRNIGVGANVLRAIESSTAEYTWLICDDDLYDFSETGDVPDIIEEGSADLIIMGSWDQHGLSGGTNERARTLMQVYKRFFSIVLFAPSTIFRTSLFDDECIRQGYRGIANLYPHFYFYSKMLIENCQVYVVQHQIVYSGANDIHGFSQLDLSAAQLALSHHIAERQLRHQVIEELLFYPLGLKNLLGRIIYCRAQYKNPLVYLRGVSFPRVMVNSILSFGFLSIKQTFYFIICLVGCFLPRPICRGIWTVYESKHEKNCQTSAYPENIRAEHARRQQFNKEGLEKKQEIRKDHV